MAALCLAVSFVAMVECEERIKTFLKLEQEQEDDMDDDGDTLWRELSGSLRNIHRFFHFSMTCTMDTSLCWTVALRWKASTRGILL